MASEKHEIDPFAHVADSDHFEIFDPAHVGFHLPSPITKFMVMEFLVGVLIVWGFIWVARRIATGEVPRGKLWNFLEWVLLFIRDQVAKPALGEHDYKR